MVVVISTELGSATGEGEGVGGIISTLELSISGIYNNKI